MLTIYYVLHEGKEFYVSAAHWITVPNGIEVFLDGQEKRIALFSGGIMAVKSSDAYALAHLHTYGVWVRSGGLFTAV